MISELIKLYASPLTSNVKTFAADYQLLAADFILLKFINKYAHMKQNAGFYRQIIGMNTKIYDAMRIQYKIELNVVCIIICRDLSRCE